MNSDLLDDPLPEALMYTRDKGDKDSLVVFTKTLSHIKGSGFGPGNSFIGRTETENTNSKPRKETLIKNGSSYMPFYAEAH